MNAQPKSSDHRVVDNLRPRDKEYSILPSYHGFSDLKLESLHEELPKFTNLRLSKEVVWEVYLQFTDNTNIYIIGMLLINYKIWLMKQMNLLLN